MADPAQPERASFADFIGRAGRAAPDAPNTMPTMVEDPVAGALAGLSAIYETVNRQAERVPGAKGVAKLARRGSEALYGWVGEAPAGSDMQKSRATFAKLYDFLAPQDAVGAILAAIPPARVGKARNFRYFHGTSPKLAKKLIAEGAQSGRSALLGVEGTSLSRDPNVSLHRFAHGDPGGLLIADVPPGLLAETRHMNVSDFVDTKRLLEENPGIKLYNKPSTLYKELETFVRREHIPDESGQLGLFRPTDEIKFRRPTAEEMRYATTVSKNVSDAMDVAEFSHLRTRAAFSPEKFEQQFKHSKYALRVLDIQRLDKNLYNRQFFEALGPPSPREVLMNYKQMVGSGSNTQRAKVLATYEGPFASVGALPMMVAGDGTLYLDRLNTTLPRNFSGRVTLSGGVPRVASSFWSKADEIAEQERTVSEWYNGLSAPAKKSLKEWDTPRGRALLGLIKNDQSYSMVVSGKSNVEAALRLRKLKAGSQADTIVLNYQETRYPENRSVQAILPELKDRGNAPFLTYLNFSHANELPPYTRIDDKHISVRMDDLDAALVKTGNRLVHEGIRAREETFKALDNLSQ